MEANNTSPSQREYDMLVKPYTARTGTSPFWGVALHTNISRESNGKPFQYVNNMIDADIFVMVKQAEREEFRELVASLIKPHLQKGESMRRILNCHNQRIQLWLFNNPGLGISLANKEMAELLETILRESS